MRIGVVTRLNIELVRSIERKKKRHEAAAKTNQTPKTQTPPPRERQPNSDQETGNATPAGKNSRQGTPNPQAKATEDQEPEAHIPHITK